MYQFIVMFKSSIFSKFPTFPISKFSQLFPPKKTFKEVGFPSQNSFFRLIKPFPPYFRMGMCGTRWFLKVRTQNFSIGRSPNPAPPAFNLTGTNIPKTLIKHPCKICRDKFDTRLGSTRPQQTVPMFPLLEARHKHKPHKLLKHDAEHFPNCELKVENAEELELHDQAVHQFLLHDKPICPKCLMCFDTNEEFQEHLPRHITKSRVRVSTLWKRLSSLENFQAPFAEPSCVSVVRSECRLHAKAHFWAHLQVIEVCCRLLSKESFDHAFQGVASQPDQIESGRGWATILLLFVGIILRLREGWECITVRFIVKIMIILLMIIWLLVLVRIRSRSKIYCFLRLWFK